MGALGVSTWQLLLLVMGKGPDQYCVGHFILALLGSETNVPSHLMGLYFWQLFSQETNLLIGEPRLLKAH